MKYQARSLCRCGKARMVNTGLRFLMIMCTRELMTALVGVPSEKLKHIDSLARCQRRGNLATNTYRHIRTMHYYPQGEVRCVIS